MQILEAACWGHAPAEYLARPFFSSADRVQNKLTQGVLLPR